MLYVLIGTHSPEVCPTSNKKTRELLLQSASEIPKIAESSRVKLVAGPFVNREHVTVTVVEANNGEDLDRFVLESRLHQWNSVRVLPSTTMQEAIGEIEGQTPLF